MQFDKRRLMTAGLATAALPLASVSFGQNGTPRAGASYLPGVDVTAFKTMKEAIAAAQNRLLFFPPGDYTFTEDEDFGNAFVELAPGAMLRLASDRVTIIIRNPLNADAYACLSTSGDILLGGDVNPMWFGAIPYVETLAQARLNTRAFRCAAKSFTASMTKVIEAALVFSVRIPAGIFALSNGFNVSVGVSVTGAGAGDTYLKRLSSYADPSEPQIPLLTVGKTLMPSLKENAAQDMSALSRFGAGSNLGLCSNLYFTDQSQAGTLKMQCPGMQFSDLAFTACSTALIVAGGDITGSNVIIDMGLTGILFHDCQNIVLANVLIYNAKGQAIAFAGECRDIVVSGLVIEYPEYLGVVFSEGNGPFTNIRISDFTFFMNEQFPKFAGMINSRANHVDVAFSNGSIRNVMGPAIVNTLVNEDASFTFSNVVFDGARTIPAYKQTATMSMITAWSGDWTFNDCEVRNLHASSTLAHRPSIRVNGLRYRDVKAAALFDTSAVSTGLTARARPVGEFRNVTGDALVPLVSATAGGLHVRMKGCTDVLGEAKNHRGALAWMIPLSVADIVQVTVSASMNAKSSGRKVASFMIEKSSDSVTGDVLVSTAVSTTEPGPQGELLPSMVFSNDLDKQPTTAPNPTFAVLHIPASCSEATVQVEYLT